MLASENGSVRCRSYALDIISSGEPCAGLLCAVALPLLIMDVMENATATMKPAQPGTGTEEEQATAAVLVRAFAAVAVDECRAENAGGNPCLLQVLDQFPGCVPPTATQYTLCQSWADRSPEGPLIAVRCFTPGGRRIDCCGHGLLTAGHIWLRRLQRDALVLSMHGSQVRCWQREEITWLEFKRLIAMPCAVPCWINEVFPGPIQAVAAASCGDEQGYLVVQWPDDFDLKQLPSPARCLSNRSQRAIICTAAQLSTGTDAITLRYFAPQYGVLEDIATGSAMRILADYWSPRFASLSAVQCSAAGGLLLARIAADSVQIGGHCLTVCKEVGNV